MPQMREAIPAASSQPRPRKNASKKRGGSKILSFTSTTVSPSIFTNRAPSPSTRVSKSTRIVLVLVLVDLFFMGLAFQAECFCPSVEISKDSHNVKIARSELAEPGGQGSGVRRFLGAEAAVAAPIVGGT